MTFCGFGGPRQRQWGLLRFAGEHQRELLDRGRGVLALRHFRSPFVSRVGEFKLGGGIDDLRSRGEKLIICGIEWLGRRMTQCERESFRGLGDG